MSLILFDLFWKVVGILDDKFKIKVMAVASDEPSENQTKQKMHRDMKHSTVTRMERRTWYITQKNSLKKDGREILFIGD